MANAEDVVLYDLNGDASAEELIEMMNDPELRWFAQARLAALAQRGVVAAGWNPALHPRGHDGKFIEVWGWVNWLGKDGHWKRGQVTQIQPGNILVQDYGSDTVYGLKPQQLYRAPTSKASLTLPNPSKGESGGHGFSQVGQQGGSNPGGLYQVEAGSDFTTGNGMDPKGIQKIADKYGLTTAPKPEYWGAAPRPSIVFSENTGRVGFVPPDGGVPIDAYGETVSTWPLSDAKFLTGGESADVLNAWGEVSAITKLLSDGDKVYIKYAKSEQHAANEVLANRLYELAGVNVAETIMGDDSRTIGSKLIPVQATKIDLGDAVDDADAMAKFRADFAVDAWLANWDVAGLSLENTQVVDGYPYRIDAGGALLYRAQGGPKGSMFGPVVGEIDTLRDKGMNPQAAKVFGPVTDAEIRDGVERIAAIAPGQIEALAMASGLDDGQQKHVSDTLIARRAYLLEKFDVADPWLKDDDGNYAGIEPATEIATPQEEFAEQLEKLIAEEGEIAKTLSDAKGKGKLWSIFHHGWMQETSAQSLEDFKDIYQSHLDAFYAAAYIDHKAVDLNMVDLHGEDAYVLVDGQTYKLTDIFIGGGVQLTGINALGQTEVFNFPEDTILVGHIGPKGLLDYSKIRDAEIGLADATISLQLLDDDFDIDKLLYDGTTYALLEPLPSEASMDPFVKAHIGFVAPHGPVTEGWYTFIATPAPTDMAYVKVKGGKLFRVKSVTNRQGDEAYGKLVDPFTGEVPGEDDINPEELMWVVHNGYTKELIDAYVLKNGGNLGPVVDTEKSTLDAATKATLDAKAVDSGADIDPNESSDDPDWLTSAIAAYGLKSWNWEKGPVLVVDEKTNTAVGYSLDGGLATYGTDGNAVNWPMVANAYTGSPEAVLAVWNMAKAAALPTADSNSGEYSDLDKAAAQTFLDWFNDKITDGEFANFIDSAGTLSPAMNVLDAAGPFGVTSTLTGVLLAEKILAIKEEVQVVDPDVDIPDSSLSAGSIGHSINGVHKSLSVGESFKLDTENAASLVGKMVLVSRSDLIPEEGPVTLTKMGTGPSFTVGYVEAISAGSYLPYITIRLSNGKTHSFPVKPSTYEAVSQGKWRVVENMTPDDLKLASSPTVKPDGTIVRGGKVIGNWEEVPHSSGAWYHKSTYKWTIFAEHTVIGKEIQGVNKAKTHIKERIIPMLIPQAPPVKVKKGSAASKKIADAVTVAATPSLANAFYKNGDEAKLGDWVQSTKGGGGFVGKLVGWPNQKTDPGIVFVVGVNGVQKAVKLWTSKKVPKPADDAPTAPTFDGVPNLYAKLALQDGKVPQIGQKVMAGKAGAKKVEGYIAKIDANNEWVYIQTWDNPLGTFVSKTMNVTQVVEEPKLWWNEADAAVIAVLATKPAAKGKKKVPGYTYPGPGGAVYSQKPAVQEAWLAGNPKRKLTKDGYAPAIGMNVRNKAGDPMVVLAVADEWEPNPNRIRAYNFTANKLGWVSTTGIELDHEAMLTAFDGKPVKFVKGIEGFSSKQFPEGTVIWRIPQSKSSYDHEQKKTRYHNDWKYFIVQPNGQSYEYGAAADWEEVDHEWVAPGNKKIGSVWGGMGAKLKWLDPAKLEKVAEISSDGDGTVDITPTKWSGGGITNKKPFVPSAISFNEVAEADPVPTPVVDTPDVDTPEPVSVPAPVDVPETVTVPVNTNPTAADWLIAQSAVFDLGTMPNAGDSTIYVYTSGKVGKKVAYDYAVIDLNGDEMDSLLDEEKMLLFGSEKDVDAFWKLLKESDYDPETWGSDTPALVKDDDAYVPPSPGTEGDEVAAEQTAATTIGQNSITTLPAPPNPNPVTEAVVADPVLPQVAGVTDLTGKAELLKKTSALSIAEAGMKMLAQKDSKDAGSGYQYAMGDSDYIEDMTLRYHVAVDDNGTEQLVLRYRLREDVSEDLAGKLVVPTGDNTKLGAWKLAGMKFAAALEDGDLIAIYVSSNEGKPLKPRGDKADEPNARVIGTPKLVGKSKVHPEWDLYRVKVITQDGSVGEVDMEQRPESSIPTMEYDHSAPAKQTGSKLQITKTAQAEGWNYMGHMTLPGQTNDTKLSPEGKQLPQYADVGKMASGSGGHRFTRLMSDGSRIRFQSAHSSEGGIGDGTTRRANIGGEVFITVPITDGKPFDEVVKSMSQAMQVAGLPPEKQGPPSDAQLKVWALNKVVRNYHPKYTYRDKDVTDTNDARLNETFDHMTNKLQKHLGRNVTIDDVRFHVTPAGRMTVVWSPDVAKAISKSQGKHHYKHSLNGAAFPILGAPMNGVLSIDERWSMGLMIRGLSPESDMRTGAGDRVFIRTGAGTSFETGHYIMNPLMVNSHIDLYTAFNRDTWGTRTEKNMTMDSHSDAYEFNIKRLLEAGQLTFYIAQSESNRQDFIKQLHDAGVMSIAGRPVEDIVVTKEQAAKVKNFEDIGIEQFANDIPVASVV